MKVALVIQWAISPIKEQLAAPQRQGEEACLAQRQFKHQKTFRKREATLCHLVSRIRLLTLTSSPQLLGWRYHAAALYLVTCHSTLYHKVPSFITRQHSDKMFSAVVGRREDGWRLSLSVGFTWKQTVKQPSSFSGLHVSTQTFVEPFLCLKSKESRSRRRWKDFADPLTAVYSICIRSEGENEWKNERKKRARRRYVQTPHKGINTEPPPRTNLFMVPRFAEHTHAPSLCCFALQTFTELKSFAALCPD